MGEIIKEGGKDNRIDQMHVKTYNTVSINAGVTCIAEGAGIILPRDHGENVP